MSEDAGNGRETGRDKLRALDAKIREARADDAPPSSAVKDKYNAASMAWRMVIELVLSVLIGAAMGWGLDSAFGTLPLFLIVFILLGFAAGVRTMMHSAAELQKRRAAPAADEEKVAHGSE